MLNLEGYTHIGGKNGPYKTTVIENGTVDVAASLKLGLKVYIVLKPYWRRREISIKTEERVEHEPTYSSFQHPTYTTQRGIPDRYQRRERIFPVFQVTQPNSGNPDTDQDNSNIQLRDLTIATITPGIDSDPKLRYSDHRRNVPLMNDSIIEIGGGLTVDFDEYPLRRLWRQIRAVVLVDPESIMETGEVLENKITKRVIRAYEKRHGGDMKRRIKKLKREIRNEDVSPEDYGFEEI